MKTKKIRSNHNNKYLKIFLPITPSPPTKPTSRTPTPDPRQRCPSLPGGARTRGDDVICYSVGDGRPPRRAHVRQKPPHAHTREEKNKEKI
ncbi:hypothetical protein E2C01_041816 [Portunus trituberculatus]|uniref:Uncharacterized protein n=1 Tax=Portunus trituberculatus TaxID=210409 RepID=A0A5B7FK66_PORTR|nr:hypothetical protein [Portunus trituberculatus]